MSKLFKGNGRAALVLYLALQDSKCLNSCYSTPLWKKLAFIDKQGMEKLQVLDFSIGISCFSICL